MRLPPLRASFRQQIVGLTAAVTASAVALLTVLVWFVLGQITSRDLDLVLQDRAASVIEGIQAEGPSFVVPRDRLDAGVAVYDAQGRLVDGAPPQAMASLYGRLSTSTTTVVTRFGEDNRVRAEPFTTNTGAKGVVVVSEALGPYGEAQRLALIVTIATGALTVAAAAGIAAWATRRALQTGRRDGPDRHRVERAGPQQPLQSGAAGERADGTGRDTRQAARPGLLGDPLRAAAHLGAGPRAEDPAHLGPGDGRAAAPTRAAGRQRPVATSRRSPRPPSGWPTPSPRCSSSPATRPSWSSPATARCATWSRRSPTPLDVHIGDAVDRRRGRSPRPAP